MVVTERGFIPLDDRGASTAGERGEKVAHAQKKAPQLSRVSLPSADGRKCPRPVWGVPGVCLRPKLESGARASHSLNRFRESATT
jgi:hypothetical protein